MSLDVEAPAEGWGAELRLVSDDRLLLLEMAHRVANEVAAAIAALRLIRPAGSSSSRWRLLAGATARLEGFALVNRVLAIPDHKTVRLDRELERLGEGLGAARAAGRGSAISLDVPETVVGGAVARRMLLIAAELTLNAIRHALEGRDGRLTLALRRDCRDLMLCVADDGPGMDAATSVRGAGMGGHLVTELVRRAGGVMECRTGPEGTTFNVALPFVPADADGPASG